MSDILLQEFPGIKGFSVQNSWYMRQIYREYHDSKKLQPQVGEISWNHNLIIMSRCKDLLERGFYFRMTRKLSWRLRMGVLHRSAVSPVAPMLCGIP